MRISERGVLEAEKVANEETQAKRIWDVQELVREYCGKS